MGRYLYETIEMASLRILSPKIRLHKVLSALISLKIAKTLTNRELLDLISSFNDGVYQDQ